MANIIDGKQASQARRTWVKEKVAQRLTTGKRAPGLAVILVGNDPASEVYVKNKIKACEQVGFLSRTEYMAVESTQEQLIDLIKHYNQDPTIDGILVQLPLPQHIDTNLIIDTISPDKDVDGFHPYNLGCLAQRRPRLRPCTPFGIIRLLEYHNLPLKGLRATVVGASNIVGRPMSLELLLAGATVTTAHRFTKNLQQCVEQAELLVVATGRRGIVHSEWIADDAIVVDVGIHRLDNGQLCGDLDYASASERAAWITPVPGGVGPMTISTLLENTLYTAEYFHTYSTSPKF